MKKVVYALIDMFKGNKGGKLSIIRVLSFSVVYTVLGVYVAHNIVSMIFGHGYVSVSWQDVSLILGALGCKTIQTKYEGKTSPAPQPVDEPTPDVNSAADASKPQ